MIKMVRNAGCMAGMDREALMLLWRVVAGRVESLKAEEARLRKEGARGAAEVAERMLDSAREAFELVDRAVAMKNEHEKP